MLYIKINTCNFMEVTFVSEVVKLVMLMGGPTSVAPALFAILGHLPTLKRLKIVSRELLITLILIVGFFYSGSAIMSVLCISINAIRFGGGLLLLYSGFQVLYNDDSFSKEEGKGNGIAESEPFIVPIVMPLLFGPAVMTAIIQLSADEVLSSSFSLSVIFVSWVITAIICAGAIYFGGMINKKVFEALGKFGGLILVYLAAQMIYVSALSVVSIS